MRSLAKATWTFVAVLFLATCAHADARLDAAMDAIVTRLYASNNLEQLQALDEAKLAEYITPGDRAALASAYWTFDVDVPVVVSVMRHMDQAQVPFWLEESGFAKTDLVVKNESNNYAVWQKKFDAGHVGLGMNGFDGHRFSYFASVGPQNAGDVVKITNLVPAHPPMLTMEPGAMTYIDWTELVLTEAPESLRGHALLTTFRGRARETHLTGGGFRETLFPASDKPDQITLTWNGDPKTSQAVLWRTNTAVKTGAARFSEKGSDARQMVDATLETIDDRMLANDRTSHRFTAVLSGLKPGTTYVYQVGEASRDVWSDVYEFTTAPENGDTFSFAFLTDTHNRETAGKALAAAYARTPRPAFTLISGDLVDFGLHRDTWDKLFAYMGEPLARYPTLPAIGNHDDQDGLGPGTFLKQFALPDINFDGIPTERAYSVRYANALFLVLPIGISIDSLRDWMEKELSATDATWKFALYHFPVYTNAARYQNDYDQQREKWGALFDKYHLDFMLTGHTHRYNRTNPIRNGKEVTSAKDGTYYVVSAPGFYQTIDIKGNRLEYTSHDPDGVVKDHVVVEK
ncbi:MAG: metallophosphoesterase family protein [Candidatus Hydrogenedentes bacterium]|nr:metallophosphoesterase family protein [Candidatus Hydrogenedentota bacterium]